MTVMRLNVIILTLLCLFTGEAYSCSPEIVFRAYLDKRFWQPYEKYESSVLPFSKMHNIRKINMASQKFYFAGTSDEKTTSPGLTRARNAYRSENYDLARKELSKADKTILTATELEELVLLDAKLDMRIGEKTEPVNKQLLKTAQNKLLIFIKNSKSPTWHSEARGWVAHIHFLLEEYPAAAKIYLDELGREDTIFSQDSIASSLYNIFYSKVGDEKLVDHLEEYFDTREHALFVVYLVTNPTDSMHRDMASVAKVGRKTIATLQRRSDLFNKNKMSDVLALALMRAALYMGDTQAAITFSKKVPDRSKVARSSEYNWIVGVCHFLRCEYAAAEEPLLKVLKSNDVNRREYRAAAQGLMGVYQKLGRRVDQLHAALSYSQKKRSFLKESLNLNPYVSLPEQDGGSTFDLPYLLDIQLTDDELREYLVRYEKESKNIVIWSYRRNRTAYESVKYALAVRCARHEKYREAAEIYAEINARPRALRMRELAGIYEYMESKKTGSPERWVAEYKYASFLEEHSTQILFNDMFWDGLQTWVFLDDKDSSNREESKFTGLTKKERDYYLKEERRIRDEQEERWRAYHILNNIVNQAGYSEIGKKAAVKAIRCLDMICTERFGREKEIASEKKRLVKWLHLAG
jgi:hypothetical protein